MRVNRLRLVTHSFSVRPPALNRKGLERFGVVELRLRCCLAAGFNAVSLFDLTPPRCVVADVRALAVGIVSVAGSGVGLHGYSLQRSVMAPWSE